MISFGGKSAVAMATAVFFVAVSFQGSCSVTAFCSPSSTPFRSSKANSERESRLYANSKNIKAAIRATEQYGIYSPQARLAWEVVEEFDASTNDSAAYTPSENGLSQEQLQQAYEDVRSSMEIMQRNQYAAVSFQNNQQLMKDVAAELKAIKLSPPTKKPPPTIPGLWDSKLKARAITQQFGTSSAEAKLAWEEVEEIASSGLENAVGGTLFEEESCDLAKAAEACMALEELDRFLYYENYHAADNIENTIAEDYSESYDENYGENYDYSNNNNHDNNQEYPETGGGGGTYY